MFKNFVGLLEKIHATLAPISLLEFFRKGFKLTSDDRFQQFNIKFSPWISTLCEWFQDSKTEWIYLVQGSQTAKTTFMMGVLLWVSQYAKGAAPVLWVMAIEEEAKIFVTERLKQFLIDAGSDDAMKSWKMKAFRFYNSLVKIGYASTKTTLRTMPCCYVFGDECGIWKESVSYVKKRTRTFRGRRKGIFATTPPENGEHHSWKEATAGNFYQWWVPCPDCGKFQGLIFSNIKFSGKDEAGNWDFSKVQLSARYACQYCDAKWHESQKLDIINSGKAVCVDFRTYDPVPEKKGDSKTLQISSKYSVFTPWGQLAVDFLTAKKSGPKALKIFFSDELAEVQKIIGVSFRQHELKKYIDISRLSGFRHGYSLITAGVDIQRLGELYYVISGWRSGVIPAADVLQYGRLRWKDINGQPKWDELLELIGQYPGLKVCALDASDGVVYPTIIDFCAYAGDPYIALKEVPSLYTRILYKAIQVDPVTKQKVAFGHRLLQVNSHLIKDDIASAFGRMAGDPGAWTFPGETTDEFLKHLTNEHRTTEKRGSRVVTVWKPKYAKAPQHWFSALVYSCAAMDDWRYILQKKRQVESKPVKKEKQPTRWINAGNKWF